MELKRKELTEDARAEAEQNDKASFRAKEDVSGLHVKQPMEMKALEWGPIIPRRMKARF